MLRFLHPILFYPLALLAAALIIFIGVQPQRWPRPPAPVSGDATDNGLMLSGAALGTPAPGPRQSMNVTRDFLGRAQSLSIAVPPEQPSPGPSDTGVRILLAPGAAARIENRPTLVEVAYEPLPFNGAEALAVSLQGDAPPYWATQPLTEEPGRLQFELPPQTSISAIGLRAIAAPPDIAFGVTILEVRVVPRV